MKCEVGSDHWLFGLLELTSAALLDLHIMFEDDYNLPRNIDIYTGIETWHS